MFVEIVASFILIPYCYKILVLQYEKYLFVLLSCLLENLSSCYVFNVLKLTVSRKYKYKEGWEIY